MGEANVDRLLLGMLCTEFVELKNFAELEPFGAMADEIHLAGIRTQIANYLRRSGTSPVQITDFMLTAKKPPQEQSPQQIYKLMKGK